MRQAIETRYCGPTNTRGSRVQVKSQATPRGKYYPWQHECDGPDNHMLAARAYAESMGWLGEGVQMFGGALADGTGYAFVLVGGAS